MNGGEEEEEDDNGDRLRKNRFMREINITSKPWVSDMRWSECGSQWLGHTHAA